MLKKISFWMILIGIMSSSCSNQEKSESEDIVNAGGVESADFLVDSDSDFLFEEDLIFEEEVVETAEAPIEQATSEADYMVAMEEERVESPTPAQMGEMGTYQVQNGDTLMMVAFHLYGDYRKWKDLRAWNPNISSQNLVVGEVLSYEVPDQQFSWNPAGVSYLVKRGDSLGSISDDKYGTVKRWRDIFENNQPLIRDPDLIFAGFTLYYVPDRDLASQ